MRQRIQHYNKEVFGKEIVGKINEKESYKAKIENNFEKFQKEMAIDIKIIEEEANHIEALSERYCSLDK